MIHEHGGRDTAFIEYIPGEYAWRVVYAPNYLVVHCLWVVGKGKGKGYGSCLIQEAVDDARQQGKAGVVMVTSDRIWLAHKQIFLHNGFSEVETAPPCFQLMTHVFDDGAVLPSFPQDWDARSRGCGSGLTMFRTPQCPYIENAVNDLFDMAREYDLPARVVVLQTAREVQLRSPSPYGTFGAVLDGSLLSYHYLLRKDFEKLIAERDRGGQHADA